MSRYKSGRELARLITKGKITTRFIGDVNITILESQIKSLKLRYRPKHWWQRDPDKKEWHERAARILDGAKRLGEAEYQMVQDAIDDIVGKGKAPR